MAEVDWEAIDGIRKMLVSDLTAAYSSQDPGQRADLALNYLNMLLNILSRKPEDETS